MSFFDPATSSPLLPHFLGLIGFIAVSLLAHLPAIRNTMAAGLNCCSWILLILALALPVYCIIVETAELKKE